MADTLVHCQARSSSEHGSSASNASSQAFEVWLQPELVSALSQGISPGEILISPHIKEKSQLENG